MKTFFYDSETFLFNSDIINNFGLWSKRFALLEYDRPIGSEKYRRRVKRYLASATFEQNTRNNPFQVSAIEIFFIQRFLFLNFFFF